jgi:predicted nuclease of predicted toxin-antitoxin system
VRWLVDECVAAILVARLRETGHDAAYVAELASGIADPEIIGRAVAEERLLLTDDKDFGELVMRRRWRLPGVVLLRVPPERHELAWRRLEAAIAEFGESLFGRYTVVEAARLRLAPAAGVAVGRYAICFIAKRRAWRAAAGRSRRRSARRTSSSLRQSAGVRVGDQAVSSSVSAASARKPAARGRRP